MKKTQTKTKKRSNAKMFVALALSAILLAGGVAVGYGAGTRWTYKRGPVQATLPDDTGDDIGGSTITDGKEDNGIHVTPRKLERTEYAVNGISENADSAFEIIVEIEPSVATNKLVNCTFGWLDPNSEWAKGEDINDYYSVTPTAEGSLKFNAVCKQPFAEPINIIFTSKEDRNITKTVRADYVAKLLEFSLEMTPIQFVNMDSHGYYYADWTIGTITCENFEITNFSYKYTEDFLATIDEEYDLINEKFDGLGSLFSVNYDYIDIGVDRMESYEEHENDCIGESVLTYYEDLLNYRDGVTVEQMHKIRDCVFWLVNLEYGRDIVDGIVWHIEYSYILDGETHNRTYEQNGEIDCNYVTVPVTGLVTNKDNIKH